MGREGDYIPIAVFFFFLFLFSSSSSFLLLFYTPSHGLPHTVFGGFISISGRWVLLRRERINAGDSGDITMQHTTTF